MKYPIIVRSKWFPMHPFMGISLCGVFIFRSDCRVDENDIRHEHIHLLQQLEWGFIGFFVLYHCEFLYYFARRCMRSPRGTTLGQRCMAAYRDISFEREAYEHDSERDYLKTRRHWANYRMKNNRE